MHTSHDQTLISRVLKNGTGIKWAKLTAMRFGKPALFSFFVLATLAMNLLFSGCSPPDTPQDLSPETPTSPPTNDPLEETLSETNTQSVSDSISVDLIDEDGFATLLEENRGRVVLVDFWATWCTNCIEQLPHTVKLNQKYADEGLLVVTISLDEPEEREGVLTILRKKDATTANFISRYGGSDKSMRAFAIEGGIPHYKLYDRQGKLHHTFVSGQQNIDLDEMDRLVAELLSP